MSTLFGVTYDSVRRHHFPVISNWDSTTSPTDTTVTEMIDAAAAKLAGKLLLKSITASEISDTATAAYAWCADTIRLEVATRIPPTVSGVDPDEYSRRRAQLKERYEDLDEHGAEALGGGASANATDSEPEGPVTYLTENPSIDTGSDSDASSVVPVLRWGDET